MYGGQKSEKRQQAEETGGNKEEPREKITAMLTDR